MADQTHHRTCSLCEAMCGITIDVREGRVASIRGDKDDPFSQGYICPKATALQDIHEDGDRLRHPVRRAAGGFERIGWDEAFDEVAARLKDVQRRHGNDAVAMYLGNPNVHNHGSMLFGIPFTRSLRTRSRFSATSVDQLPHHLAAYQMFGHQFLLAIPDLDRTAHLLIVGGNPAVSNGSLMSAPGAGRRIEAIRARGGRVVVVDPRRTETSALADEHVFIRPGTDALLVLAMLQTIFAEGLAGPGRLAGILDGREDLERAASRFPPERAAAATGIDAARIRALARGFAGAPSAVAYGRMGASTQAFGGVTQWLLNALNIVTGNLDRAGGAMFTLPAVDVVDAMGRSGQRGHFARRRTRVRGLPEFGGEFPVAALAEEMLTEGPGQIRALVTSAGNPVLSTPNGRQLDRALAGLDFMVAIDFYVNETTRHANVILPPTGPLEHEHYDLVFHALAVRNTAKYSLPLFAPAPDTRHDWEIFLELTTRMQEKGAAGPMMGRAKRAALHLLTPERIIDLGLRLGPYGVRKRPLSGLSVDRLKRAPHGIDLGPLEPCLPGRLFTRDHRIPLAPELFVRDLDRLEATLLAPEAEAAKDDLKLIGRRQLRSNNSWMHNSRRLVKGRDRCTLLMHPEDAARRGLSSGQRVRVHARVGSIELGIEVSDEMMPGVVSIPHGWGHDRPGVRLGVAEKHAGASINDLTDEMAVDALCGNAAFSGIPVRVEAATA
jgi:anaerobic selenocysteine-containing dehydrogenase